MPITLRWKHSDPVDDEAVDPNRDDCGEKKRGLRAKAKKQKVCKNRRAMKARRVKKALKAANVAKVPKEQEACAAKESKQGQQGPTKAKSFGRYVPGQYRAVWLQYIRDMKQHYGCDYKTANIWWNDSDERADLLREMPLAELRRRRFI